MPVIGEGIPMRLELARAQQSEVRLADRAIATVPVVRRSGWARIRHGQFTCDQGYDNRAFQQHLRRRVIRSCILERKRPVHWKPRRGRPCSADRGEHRLRYKVERTFAWILRYWRLEVRWEHHAEVY